MKILLKMNLKVTMKYELSLFEIYPNGKANKNVQTGTRFVNAQAKVADVYSSPIRKVYCDSVTLKLYINIVNKGNNKFNITI